MTSMCILCIVKTSRITSILSRALVRELVRDLVRRAIRELLQSNELDDESVEDLGIDEVGLGENVMGEGGMGEGEKEDDNTSEESFESEEDSLMFSDWDDTDEDEIEIFPTPRGVNKVVGQDNRVASQHGPLGWRARMVKGRAKLERNKSDARYCLCNWSDGEVFEVEPLNYSRKLVNIGMKECSCGRWQLNWIPFLHTCVAIYHDRKVPEDFMDAYYRKATYAVSYATKIHAMPGSDDWPHIDSNPLMPPQVRVPAGRLKKARIRAIDEQPHPYRGTEAAIASSTAGTSRIRASHDTNTNVVINEHETRTPTAGEATTSKRAQTKTSINVASSSRQRPSTQPVASRVRSRAPPITHYSKWATWTSSSIVASEVTKEEQGRATQ
ncbi:hypothetical protein CJ030_MR2G005735 [Morella rubra]|uniref:SWIM-type domain-containing protein n=1 Tax=Morella rubra TaxID=262757 RepID=A0A6A1WG31_9ROSI|nr:hypothetical protein CJ030_MR2G005735 [Morella rubra]